MAGCGAVKDRCWNPPQTRYAEVKKLSWYIQVGMRMGSVKHRAKLREGPQLKWKPHTENSGRSLLCPLLKQRSLCHRRCHTQLVLKHKSDSGPYWSASFGGFPMHNEITPTRFFTSLLTLSFYNLFPVFSSMPASLQIILHLFLNIL